jgi:transcriptional regulator with XRE-family HTH domain
MKKSRPSFSVRRALVKLGEDIKTARLKRRIPMSLLAERSLIGLSTLEKIQKGEPGVSIGSYAAVIFSLGMGTPFAELLRPGADETGLALEQERLPKRIHGPRRRKAEA